MKKYSLALALAGVVSTGCNPGWVTCTEDICTLVDGAYNEDLDKYLQSSQGFVIEQRDQLEPKIYKNSVEDIDSLSEVFTDLDITHGGPCAFYPSDSIEWNSKSKHDGECLTKSLALRWFWVEHGKMPKTRNANDGKRDPDFARKWSDFNAGTNLHYTHLYGDKKD